MVESADIGDQESLREWLADKPPELAVLLAHRTAARVLPLYWAWAADPSTEGDVTGNALWRTLPTSRVGAAFATREFENVSASASAFVDAAFVAPDEYANDAAFAAAVAANAAAFPEDATGAATSAGFAAAAFSPADIWAEIRMDAKNYLASDMRAARPLWAGGRSGMPPMISEAWEATRAALTARVAAGETGWQFWIDWYEAQLSGAEQNWEMLKEIVLIPNDDWKQGAAHVNGLIEGIRLKYAIPASPNAEVLEVNPETGLIRARPASDISPGFLQDSLARIRDAAEIFGDPAQGNNPYGALAPEIETLHRAHDRYPDRPQRLHDITLQVVRRVAARERTGDIPEAEKDALVADFKSELIGVANDIRQQDAEVQKVVDARVTAKLDTLGAVDAQALPGAAEILAATTEGELPQELAEDAALAADAEADPETRRNAVYRFASRSFRIMVIGHKGLRGGLKEAAEISDDIAKLVVNSTKVKIAIAVLLAVFS